MRQWLMPRLWRTVWNSESRGLLWVFILLEKWDWWRREILEGAPWKGCIKVGKTHLRHIFPVFCDCFMYHCHLRFDFTDAIHSYVYIIAELITGAIWGASLNNGIDCGRPPCVSNGLGRFLYTVWPCVFCSSWRYNTGQRTSLFFVNLVAST